MANHFECRWCPSLNFDLTNICLRGACAHDPLGNGECVTNSDLSGNSNWDTTRMPQQEGAVIAYSTFRRNIQAAAVIVTTAIAAIGQIRSATSQNGISRRNTPRMITSM